MKLHLKNIGKVAEATIEIEGITVIAGENNTGKSTVGRALFSMFNCYHEVPGQIRQEQINSIANVLEKLYPFMFYESYEEGQNIDEFARNILSKADEYRQNPQELIGEIQTSIDPRFQRMKLLEEAMPIEKIEEIALRIIEVLKISDVDIFQSIINKKMDSEFDGQLLNWRSSVDGEICLTIHGRKLCVSVYEDSVFTNDMNFNLYTEAFYIDDPLVLDDIRLSSIRLKKQGYLNHRMHLESKLFMGKKNVSVVDEIVAENKLKTVYKKLMSVSEGDIVKQKNGRLGYRLHKSDKTLSIRNLSTGLKTFAILQTLLENGTIEKGGTIILDEPEIHLHPEWQLLFAELIILLHKEFGMHILLNTHSPYFLRAIQVYSAKYEVSDMCRYYLSENGENERAYIHDVTDSIDSIYEKLSEPLQKLEDERWRID